MDSEQPPLPPQPGGQEPASLAEYLARTAPPPGPPAPPLPRWNLGPFSSALLSVLTASLLGLGFAKVSIGVFQLYGWVLFLLSPLICGFTAGALHARFGKSQPWGQWKMGGLVIGLLVVSFMSILMITSGMEGLICLIMAAPLTWLLAALGATLGRGVGERQRRHQLPLLTTVVLLYPMMQQYEASLAPDLRPQEVVTRLRVQASPERIWQVLNQPVQYPAEVGLLFKAGVAYPTRTALETDAAGRRVLTCAYSQGAARLPITVWQPGRELRFAVPETPAPMQELTPYPKLHAPHLHGYFRVESGTFRLLPQPDGSTVLEGRTVYRHAIGPRRYWQLWSDYLLDDMHARVLTAIKTQAEHE